MGLGFDIAGIEVETAYFDSYYCNYDSRYYLVLLAPLLLLLLGRQRRKQRPRPRQLQSPKRDGNSKNPSWKKEKRVDNAAAEKANLSTPA